MLRSTLYPGTTDWVDAHIKRQGRNLKVAFCPERIVQGQGIDELARMPQIISGTSPEAEQEAAALFERIAPEVTLLKPIEAEFAKLFTNAYRYIGFAITNQFYLIAKSAGLDYNMILTAMKHDYPRAEYHPDAGLCRRALPGQGHDAALSPSRATSSHSATPPSWSTRGCRCTSSASLRRSHDLSKMTVGLLGMAFKAESDDPRASLSYKFKKALAGMRARC